MLRYRSVENRHFCHKQLAEESPIFFSHDTDRIENDASTSFLLKLVVCILLRVLGQVQGFRLTLEDGHKTETCSGY
jgi:hypothetical protein